ncbi:DUF4365 domain-containing protein [Frankia tisae]|uniref:DUF4365 domain-containing protein n=1 Tax=Frankia tisae TaxID=2950104 RepID=UPI0021C176A5|nr:DUF4365 domain-containing protein [Frankia tisae]
MKLTEWTVKQTVRRVPQSHQTGTKGIRFIQGHFEDIGWGAVENTSHDFGIDLYLLVRDEQLWDLSLIVTAQCKSGSSFFSEEDSEGRGWTYRESDKAHLEDWLQQPMPHLIVLHNTASNVSYWEHVTTERVQDTGAGWKIVVPRDQTVDRTCLGRLLDIATTGVRGSHGYEGSSWVTGERPVATADDWRCSLIAPRTLAPHVNVSANFRIHAVQAVALATQARYRRLDEFASACDEVPTWKEAIDHEEWEWRLFGRYVRYRLEGKLDGLVELTEEAPSSTKACIATTIGACAFFESRMHEKAIDLLVAGEDRGNLEPLDDAWIKIHRGRFLFELGDIEGAANLTAFTGHVLRRLGGIVARALLAASAGNLWIMSDLGNRDLGELITSGDTVSSWWRTQPLVTALDDYFDRSFRAWSGYSGLTLYTEDTVATGILHFTQLAEYAGHHSGALRGCSMLARYNFLSPIANTGSPEILADSLDELRRCGDVKATEWVAHRFYEGGPLSPLVEQFEAYSPSWWTRSSCQSNLKIFEVAGDLVDDKTRTQALDFLLDGLQDRHGHFLRVASDRVHWPHYLMAAIRSTVAGGPSEVHGNLVSRILPWVELRGVSPRYQEDIGRLVRCLDWSVVSEGDRARWISAAVSCGRQSPLFRSTAASFCANGDVAALAAVKEALDAGDVGALVVTINNDLDLPPDAARSLSDMLALRIEDEIVAARAGSFGLGGVEFAPLLAWINLRFPSAARWGTVVKFLLEERVSVMQKANVCKQICANFDQLPAEVAQEIEVGFASVSAGSRLEAILGGHPDDAVFRVLGALLNNSRDSLLVPEVLRLGSSRDQNQKRSALRLIRQASLINPYCEGIAIGLTGDAEISVRIEAAKTVSFLACEGGSEIVDLRTVDAMHADGVAAPLAALHGFLESTGGPHARFHDELALLVRHPSSLVRREAQSAIEFMNSSSLD